MRASLNAEVAAAARAHFPIKVALIGSPVDLGAIPSAVRQASAVRDFLDQEISFDGKQVLLVVMPIGYGVQGLDPAATSAVASLAKPPSTSSDALARAAIGAVSRLAAASGHPIGKVSQGNATAGSGSSGLVPALILGVVAIATAVAVLALRRRAGTKRPSPRRSR